MNNLDCCVIDRLYQTLRGAKLRVCTPDAVLVGAEIVLPAAEVIVEKGDQDGTFVIIEIGFKSPRIGLWIRFALGGEFGAVDVAGFVWFGATKAGFFVVESLETTAGTECEIDPPTGKAPFYTVTATADYSALLDSTCPEASEIPLFFPPLWLCSFSSSIIIPTWPLPSFMSLTGCLVTRMAGEAKVRRIEAKIRDLCSFDILIIFEILISILFVFEN